MILGSGMGLLVLAATAYYGAFRYFDPISSLSQFLKSHSLGPPMHDFLKVLPSEGAFPLEFHSFSALSLAALLSNSELMSLGRGVALLRFKV